MCFPAASPEGQFICPGGAIYVNISPDFPAGRLMPFQPIMTFGWYRSFWKHLYGMMLSYNIGSLWWVSNGDQWIPLTNGQYHRDLILSFLSTLTNCVNIFSNRIFCGLTMKCTRKYFNWVVLIVTKHVLWRFKIQSNLNYTNYNQNNIICL